jgi:multidrug transporter EmrE-like cation transporter
MHPPPKSRPRPLIGVALMLMAMMLLPYLDVVAKFLGQQGMPVMQIVWARMAFGTLLTLPFVLRHGGPAAIRPDQPWYHTLRAVLLIAATFLFFTALKYLPIADALAIFFVQPLILTAISPFVLGEKVGPRRWAAVCVGFIGTLIIIRPGMAEVNPGTRGRGITRLLLRHDPPHRRPRACHGHHLSHQPDRHSPDHGADHWHMADTHPRAVGPAFPDRPDRHSRPLLHRPRL